MSSLIGGFVQRIIDGPPKKPPKVPVYEPPPVPPEPKKVAEPSGAPTETSNAYLKDEQRRMLGALPKPIQTKYAEDETKAKTKKAKLLGGGTGQQTSGV